MSRCERISELRERTQEARLRARGRELLQRMDTTEDELPADVSLASLGFISRPDEWLPYEHLCAVSRGRQLARRFGW